MTTKSLIDQLFKEANGALSRAELRYRINAIQNKLFSINTTEMFVRDSVTITTNIEKPVFEDLSFNPRGSYEATLSYAIGDIFRVDSYTISGLATDTSYFSVVEEFNAQPLTTELLETKCRSLSRYQYYTASSSAVVWVEGVLVPEQSLVFYNGTFYGHSTPSFTCTSDFYADGAAFGLYPVNAEVYQEGTYVSGVAETPEFIGLEGMRQINKIGIKNSNGEWTILYEPKITQSAGVGYPVKIYTAGLPLNTALDYEGWRWPNQLMNELTPLELPEQHQLGALRAELLKQVEEAAYGNSIYWAQAAKTTEEDWKDQSSRNLVASPRRKKTITYNQLAG